MDLDPQAIVDMLNEVLAEDPEAMLQLINTRPYITISAQEVVSIRGHRLSFIGLINEILRRHGEHNYLIGVECAPWDEEGTTKEVKFFHVLEMKKPEEK